MRTGGRTASLVQVARLGAAGGKLPHCLLRPGRQVDDGSGDVGVEEFCSLVAKLGIPASMAEAQGLFRRFGYDAVMPFQRWAAQLVNQPGRQLAEDMAGAWAGSHPACSASRHPASWPAPVC